MFTRYLVTIIAMSSMVLATGCNTQSVVFPSLTHSVALKNVGSMRVRDASFTFGSMYKVGGLAPNIEAIIYRTDIVIPPVATVRWRRDDGSFHEAQVKVVSPQETNFELRYHILIHDDDSLSLIVEELKDRPMPFSGQ